MLAFILRRLGQSVLVMLAVSLIAFAMFRYIGDPVNQMVGVETSPEQRAALREALGLNDPGFVQFVRFIGNVLSLDFGISYQFKQPVSGLIASRLPATLELAMVSALLALAVGVPMGIYTGIHPDSFLAKLFMAISLIGVSLPTFLIGILLIYVFAVNLHVLPSF